MAGGRCELELVARVVRVGDRLRALAAFAVVPPAVHADPAAVVNALRAEGCARVPAVGAPARRDSVLDAAARELARDAKLGDALARVGYPVASSTSFHLRGSRDDAVIRRMLAARYCDDVNDAKLAELGVHQSGRRDVDRDGRPHATRRSPRYKIPPPSRSACSTLVNAARGEAAAVRPRRLRCGAAARAVDDVDGRGVAALARHGGARLARPRRLRRQRVRRPHDARGLRLAGLRRERRGRAAGCGSASSRRWLESPGHCATLMNARFTETAIAFALAPGKNPAVYWTQVFAAPR